MPSDQSRRVEGRFLAGTLVAFAILSFFVLEGFLQYIIGGILLVFAFFPVHRRVRRVFKRRAVAAFISFLIVIVAVVGPIVLIGFMVAKDAVNFVHSYNPDKINETVEGFLLRAGIEKTPPASTANPGNATIGNGTSNVTVPRTSQTANFIGGTIRSFASKIGAELLAVAPTLLVGLVIAGFVIYYGFAEGDEFYSKFRHALPLPDEIEERLFREIRKVTQVVFIGNILGGIAGGLVGALTFIIFKVPNPVFWGFIMIVLGILPVVGAPVVWIPVSLWLFVEGHVFAAIGIISVNLILVIGYVDHILRPKLIGKVAHVHPVLVLVGVLGGVEAFGPLGFVIGPLVLAIFVALVRSYTEWHPRWRERRAEGTERYAPAAHIEVVPAAESQARE